MRGIPVLTVATCCNCCSMNSTVLKVSGCVEVASSARITAVPGERPSRLAQVLHRGRRRVDTVRREDRIQPPAVVAEPDALAAKRADVHHDGVRSPREAPILIPVQRGRMVLEEPAVCVHLGHRPEADVAGRGPSSTLRLPAAGGRSRFYRSALAASRSTVEPQNHRSSAESRSTTCGEGVRGSNPRGGVPAEARSRRKRRVADDLPATSLSSAPAILGSLEPATAAGGLEEHVAGTA